MHQSQFVTQEDAAAGAFIFGGLSSANIPRLTALWQSREVKFKQ
jgi:hypothetical protein